MALPANSPRILISGKDAKGAGCSVKCISVSGSLTEGIAPSSFTVETAFALDETPIPITEVTLSFTDGINDTITLSDMRLDPDSTRVNRSTTGVSVTLSYLDKRWRWAYAALLDGEYNARGETGEVLSRDKTLSELIQLAAAGMGETADVTALNPTTGPGSEEAKPSARSTEDDYLYPYIKWDVTPAQNALADLCEKNGFRICLTTAGLLKIYPNGEGAVLPTTALRAYSLGLGSRPRPKNLKVYGGKNWYQMELELEPIIQDTDGSWKSYGWSDSDLEKVSYAPTGDKWTFALPQELLNSGTHDAAFYCEKSLFRAYRIKDESVTLSVTTSTGGVGSEEGTSYDERGVYSRADACRRWLDHLCQKETTRGENDETKVNYMRPYVKGYFKTRREMEDANTWDTFYERRVQVRELDKRNGVVWLPEPLIRVLIETTEYTPSYLAPAELTLVCAFEGDRFTWDSLPIDETSDLVAPVANENLAYEYVDGVAQNVSKVIPALSAVLKSERARYDATPAPRVNTYGGIVQYVPDGDIESVQWSMGVNQPPETVVAFGVSFRGQARPALRAALQAAGRAAAANVASATASRPAVNSISLLAT